MRVTQSAECSWCTPCVLLACSLRVLSELNRKLSRAEGVALMSVWPDRTMKRERPECLAGLRPCLPQEFQHAVGGMEEMVPAFSGRYNHIPTFMMIIDVN
jgi:hypothetical protein